jgi:hypothetical protein
LPPSIAVTPSLVTRCRHSIDPIHSLSFTHSLTHSLTDSLTDFLTSHSLSHFLTLLLTHSPCASTPLASSPPSSQCHSPPLGHSLTPLHAPLLTPLLPLPLRHSLTHSLHQLSLLISSPRGPEKVVTKSWHLDTSPQCKRCSHSLTHSIPNTK